MPNQNDYGVYQEGTNPELWVKTEVPLELSSADQAIDNWSYTEAASVATYLTGQGIGEFRVGRPKTPPHH